MGSLSETAVEADELFRSENVVVRRVAAGNADRWVVTFDHYGIGHGFDRPGFGEDYLRARGISAIHVLGRAEDWYQYPEMAAALAQVRAATAGAERVMTYGSSMGAYAALRFASAVGATDILALSPQYSIDPRIAPHETRWTQDAKRIRWRPDFGGPISSSARAVVIFDPTGPDRWHAERIESDLGGYSIRLPHSAHPVTTYLAEAGLLGPLVDDILAGAFEPQAFRREARRRRTGNGTYLGQLAATQPVRRAPLALALARRGLDVSPGNANARLSLARLLSREGRHDEALQIIESVVAEGERAPVYLIDYGNALLLAGRLAEARVIADEVLLHMADKAHLEAWGAYICWLNQDQAAARRHIQRAVSLEPGNADYQRSLIDYNLGAPPEPGRGGVRTTLWLRLARWFMKRPSQPDVGESQRRPVFFRPERSDPASGGVG